MTRLLACKLTDRELMARGKDVAEEAARKRQVELQAKDSSAEYKAQIARHETAIDDLLKQIRSGEQFRDTTVELIRDYKRKCVTQTRMDTGELIDTRAMSAAELQMSLPAKQPLPDVTDPNLVVKIHVGDGPVIVGTVAQIDAAIDEVEKRKKRKNKVSVVRRDDDGTETPLPGGGGDE
jgi:hypothetical protein